MNKKTLRTVTAVTAATITAAGMLTAAQTAEAVKQPDYNTTMQFQVVKYTPKTVKQVKLLKSLDDDHRLKHGEDKLLNNVAERQYVTISIPNSVFHSADETKSYAYIAKAINKKTNKKVGDIHSDYYNGNSYIQYAKKGASLTVAWELGYDAKPVKGKDFGYKNREDQTFFGHGLLPRQR